MQLNDYQKEAIKSVAIPEKNLAALAHRAFGLTGEAGELTNTLKKIIRDKNGAADKKDVERIQEKLGDTLYYLAVLAEYFDLSLEDVAAGNLEKSKKFRESRNKASS